MPPKEVSKVFANNDLERKILEAFEIFDHSATQKVDVREVGTILRSLGCCPTEAEIQEVILRTENKEASGTVLLHSFMPYMVKAIIQHRFYPASAEELLAAFRYFDKEGRGYINKEYFTQLMTEEGEPFMPDEFEEMMHTALDPVTDTITYEYYINQLMVVPKDVYDIADRIENERKEAEERVRAEKLARTGAATEYMRDVSKMAEIAASRVEMADNAASALNLDD